MDFRALAPSHAAQVVAAFTAAGMHASFVGAEASHPGCTGHVHVDVPADRQSEAAGIVGLLVDDGVLRTR